MNYGIMTLDINYLGCQTAGFMGSVAALSEIWSLSVVSYDRYSGVCYPLNPEKRFSKSQVQIHQ